MQTAARNAHINVENTDHSNLRIAPTRTAAIAAKARSLLGSHLAGIGVDDAIDFALALSGATCADQRNAVSGQQGKRDIALRIDHEPMMLVSSKTAARPMKEQMLL